MLSIHAASLSLQRAEPQDMPLTVGAENDAAIAQVTMLGLYLVQHPCLPGLMMEAWMHRVTTNAESQFANKACCFTVLVRQFHRYAAGNTGRPCCSWPYAGNIGILMLLMLDMPQSVCTFLCAIAEERSAIRQEDQITHLRTHRQTHISIDLSHVHVTTLKSTRLLLLSVCIEGT